jgi:hypothetical protein
MERFPARGDRTVTSTSQAAPSIAWFTCHARPVNHYSTKLENSPTSEHHLNIYGDNTSLKHMNLKIPIETSKKIESITDGHENFQFSIDRV